MFPTGDIDFFKEFSSILLVAHKVEQSLFMNLKLCADSILVMFLTDSPQAFS
jgi:hypothetical protein